MAQVAVDIVSIVRDAGIVGAGGAGFPTHVKLTNNVDTFIANGAECEPILETDKYLMMNSAPDIIRGLEAVMAQVGAERGIVAIKGKNACVVPLPLQTLQLVNFSRGNAISNSPAPLHAGHTCVPPNMSKADS